MMACHVDLPKLAILRIGEESMSDMVTIAFTGGDGGR